MARWLCRVSAEELKGLLSCTAEACSLGVDGWVLPCRPETESEVGQLLLHWPSEMQFALELIKCECSPSLLDQALKHPSAVMFQGRPLLLLRSGLVPFEIKRREAAMFAPAEADGLTGVVRCIPPGDSQSQLNYEWFLKQAHYRGASQCPFLPAVRALIGTEDHSFVAADSIRYRAWLDLESSWCDLHLGEADATVLIDSWQGHQRWWAPRQIVHLALPEGNSPPVEPNIECRWGLMQPRHLALVVHGFYLDRLEELLKRLPPGGEREGWMGIDLYVTTPHWQLAEASDLVRRFGWPRVRLFGVANRGRDVAPFLLNVLPEIRNTGHRFLLKLHTKASLHMDFGDAWGQHLLDDLLRPELVQQLAQSAEIGLLGPSGTLLPMSLNLADNARYLLQLQKLAGLTDINLLDISFVGGTMFAARTDALLSLCSLGLVLSDFESEEGQVDGTLSHALERWFAVAARSKGYEVSPGSGHSSLLPAFGFASASLFASARDFEGEEDSDLLGFQPEPPVVPLIDSDFFEIYAEAGRFGPYKHVATELNRRGFAVVELGRERILELSQQIRADLHDVFDLEQWKTEGAGQRLQDGWKQSAAVAELALLPKVMDILRVCWGRKPFAFQTLNFPVGTAQHFHSDSVHFSSEPQGFMCGVWVALEDIHQDSGPLEYYPWSHRLPYLQAKDVGYQQREGTVPDQTIFHEAWTTALTESQLNAEQFLPQVGQALIWTANLIHGGAAVHDASKTRWSQVSHYYFDDCRYYTPMLSDWPKGSISWRDPKPIKRL